MAGICDTKPKCADLIEIQKPFTTAIIYFPSTNVSKTCITKRSLSDMLSVTSSIPIFDKSQKSGSNTTSPQE